MKGFGRIKGHYHHLKLRGGRITKWRGKAASIAPALVALVIAAPALLHSAPAEAGCSQLPSPPAPAGTSFYLCTGNDTSTQSINFTTADDAVVVFDSNYSIDTSSTGGNAVNITSNNSPLNLDIQDDNAAPAAIRGKAEGLHVEYSGQDDVGVLLYGSVQGDTGSAIYIENTSTGHGISLAANEIRSGGVGIDIDAHGDGDVAIQVSGNITGVAGPGSRAGDDAIHVQTSSDVGTDPALGQYAVQITTTGSGKLEAGAEGIEVEHDGDKGVYIYSGSEIDAADVGISVGMTKANGSGPLDLTSDGRITAGDSGILASLNTGHRVVTVNVNADIIANGSDPNDDDYGIGILHKGKADVSITTASTADVTFNGTGSDEAAIATRHQGTGDVSITVNGNVTSKAHGIGVEHTGPSNDIDIDVNNGVTIDTSNGNGEGITIDAGDRVARVNVDADAIIHAGSGDAIHVEHDGSSAPVTSTATIYARKSITSTGGDGIYLKHEGNGAASVTANGTITAGGQGVRIDKDGDGDASIIAYGDVTANSTDNHEAALAIVHSRAGKITIAAQGDITSKTHGIGARQASTTGTENDITIDVGVDANGDPIPNSSITINTEGGNGDGIVVDAGEAGDVRAVRDITVRANAEIKAANGDGIYVSRNSNIAGDTLVHAYKDVSSTGSDGIDVEHRGAGAASVTADATVTAGDTGIYLEKDGNGDATVTAKGDVTANGNDAGADYGIGVKHNAQGKITISSTASRIMFNGSDNKEAAVLAEHTGQGDVEITINSEVQSDAHGVGAMHYNTGDVSITTTKKITSAGVGVAALREQAAANGKIEIVVEGDIDADDTGIEVSHAGTSSEVNVTVNNGVTIDTTGGTGAGIDIEAGVNVASVAVDADALIKAGGDGISVEHATAGGGTSRVSVRARKTVTAAGDYGIFLEHGGAGEASITADAKVDAAHGGIVLSKTGDGKATVTAAAVEADGTAMGQPGIGVKHSANGDIEINANGNVTAKLHGIAALHTGHADEVKVTVNNGVTIDASGGDGHGILVDTTDGGANNMVADVIINANAEIKANTGDAVHVKHDGSGRTTSVASVHVHRDISSTSGDGVDLTHNGNGNASITTDGSVNAGNNGLVIAKDGNGDATITAGGSVTGDQQGIAVSHNGSTGNTTINAADAITGGNADGVNVAHAAAGDVSVTANGMVTGGLKGIKVDHTGDSGNVTISALAKIDANGGDGVNALVAKDGAGDLTVTVADVEASEDGLDLTNHGSGGVFVTANGNINGGSPVGDDAIYIKTDASAGTAVAGTYAVEVTTAAGKKLEATKDGIDVDHYGAKGVLINSSAEIETQNGDGINVRSNVGPVDINSKGKITAGNGVLAYLAGNGDITIDVDASVDADYRGVSARVEGNGNIDITTTVNAAITTNDNLGVQAYVTGAGDINIETNGSINAGDHGNGVHARNRTGDITIETNGAIDGGQAGIESSVLTNGSISIETNNAVKGNIHGIDVRIVGAGTIDVTVNSDVTGGSSWAIRTATPAGDMTNITINQGTVRSASGQAIINNKGDSNVMIAAAATIEGKIELGWGADNLTINGADVTGVTRFDGGLGHDELTFNGVTLNALNAGTVANWEKLELTGNSNITMNFGTLDVGALAVGAGSVLRAFNSVVVSGNVTNNGTISLHDDATGDILDIGGNLDGDGAYVIDTVLNDGQVDVTDKIVIAGDNNGTITIDVRNAGGAGGDTGTGPTDGIQVVDIQGANNGQLALAGPVVAGGYLYELTQNGYLQSRPIGGGAVAVAPLMMPWSTQGLWQRISNGIASSSARMRDTEVAGFTITPTAAPVELLQGAWVRVRYDYMKADADVTTAGVPSDLTARQHRVTAQLGYTHVLSRSAAGQLTGGVFAQYVHTKLSADPNIGQDSASRADAFGGGASLTWLGGNGFYGDLYGEVNRHRMKVRDDSVGDSGKTWATSWNASIEGGYRLPVAPNMNIIPHAQLVMSGSKIEDFSIGTVNYSDMDGSQVVGRLGVSAEVLNMAIGRETDLTARFSASVLRAFRRKADMVMSGQTVDTKMARTLMEVSSSLVATTPSQGMSIVLENSFQHSLKGPKQYSFSASLGVKFSF